MGKDEKEGCEKSRKVEGEQNRTDDREEEGSRGKKEPV